MRKKQQQNYISDSDEHWTISKVMLGKLCWDEMEHIIMGFSKGIDTILNWSDEKKKKKEKEKKTDHKLSCLHHSIITGSTGSQYPIYCFHVYIVV